MFFVIKKDISTTKGDVCFICGRGLKIKDGHIVMFYDGTYLTDHKDELDAGYMEVLVGKDCLRDLGQEI